MSGLNAGYAVYIVYTVTCLLSWESKGTPQCPPPQEIRPYLGVIHHHRPLNTHEGDDHQTGGRTEALLGHEDDAAQAAEIALATKTRVLRGNASGLGQSKGHVC